MISRDLFIACEFDEHRSQGSRVILGIFGSYKTAINAFYKLYGEIQKDTDGGELGFIPLANLNNVRLQILKASLDEIEEI
jgi:hypothetical protein